MSDFAWLETELARQFAPVSAPDELWRRIHEQRRPLRVRPRRWTMWLIATASLLFLSMGLFFRFGANRNSENELDLLADGELRGILNGSGNIDFRSSEPGEIRAWIMGKSGIDVQLPEHPIAEMVRVLGARIVTLKNSSVAVVTYRVGDDDGAMLVTKRRPGLGEPVVTRHTSWRTRTTGSFAAYSWRAGNQDYAIAFADLKEPRRACTLCHAQPPALLVFR